MASISKNGSNGHHKFTLNVTETGTSVENNTSSISWSFVLSSLGGGWDWYYSNQVPVTYTVVINGNKYTGNIMNYNGNSTVTVKSGTLTVAHNDDGNKTIAFSFSVSSIGQNYLPGSANASGSMALTTIARASQPSCIEPYPNHTQNVGEFGDTIYIYMNRKSSQFTHNIYGVFGSRTVTIGLDVATGTTWKIPLDFMDLIPNSLSGSGTIYVDTYNGSKMIGTKYCGFTATVPASVKPTVKFGEVVDITKVTGIYGSPAKGLSKIKITVNATPAYSSPIASYKINANGATYSTKEATTDFLKTAGESVITVTATDKRGRTNSASLTMDVYDYYTPAITKLTAIRCDKDGSTNKRGAYIKAIFSADVSSMDLMNTASYSIKYKKTSETEWTELETDANGKTLASIEDNFAPSDESFVFAAGTGNSYDVVVSVVDRHNESNPATKSAKAPTGFSVFSWRGFKNSSGTKEDGAGIGKVPEKPNCLQVGWDAEFEKEIFYKGKTLLDFVYPVGSIYTAVNHTNPGTLFGGTWERLQDGFLWASRATDTMEQTGGEKTHTLTLNEMPKHSHELPINYGTNAGSLRGIANWNDKASLYSDNVYVTKTSGGGAAHNNMPPYIQVSMWKRIS